MYEPYIDNKPAGEPYGMTPVTFYDGLVTTVTTTAGSGGGLFTGAEDFQGATGVVIDEIAQFPLRLSGNLLNNPTALSFEGTGPFSEQQIVTSTVTTGETSETTYEQVTDLYRAYTGSGQFLSATGVIIDEVNGYPLRWSGSALDQPTEVSFENSGAFGLDSYSVRWTGKQSIDDGSSNEGGGGAWIMDGELFAQCARGTSTTGGMSYSVNCFWPTSGIPIDHENNGNICYIVGSLYTDDDGGTAEGFIYMWVRPTGSSWHITDAGRMQIAFRGGTVSSSSNYYVETSPGLPGATTNPEWINYTVTVNANGTIALYVDGVLVPATSASDSIGTNGMNDYDIANVFDIDNGQGLVRWGGGGQAHNGLSAAVYGNYHGNGSGNEQTNYYDPAGSVAYGRYPCFGSGYLGDIALYDADLTAIEVANAHDPNEGYLDENGYIDLRGTGIGAEHLTGWWRMRPALVAEAIISGGSGRLAETTTTTTGYTTGLSTGTIPATHDDSKSVRWTGVADPQSPLGDHAGPGNYMVLHSDTFNDIVRDDDGFSIGMWVKFPTSGVPLAHEVGASYCRLFSDNNNAADMVTGASDNYADYMLAYIRTSGVGPGTDGGSDSYLAGQIVFSIVQSKASNYGYNAFYTDAAEFGAIEGGEWKHLLFTADRTGASGEIYVNGEPKVTSRSTPATYNLSTYKGWSGDRGGFVFGPGYEHLSNGGRGQDSNWDMPDGTEIDSSATLFGSGYLAEAAIWGRMLTSGEASGVYNTGGYINLTETSGSDRLSGWWRMNATTVTDAITSGEGTTTTETVGEARAYNIADSFSVFSTGIATGDVGGDEVVSLGDGSLEFDGSAGYLWAPLERMESVFRGPFAVSMWYRPDDGRPADVETLFVIGNVQTAHGAGGLSGNHGDFMYAQVMPEGGSWPGKIWVASNIRSNYADESEQTTSAMLRTTNSAMFSDGAASAWAHVVVQFDAAGDSTIYKNGYLQSTTVINPTVVQPLHQFSATGAFKQEHMIKFGNYGLDAYDLILPESGIDGPGSGDPQYQFDGTMDQISIWSGQLTTDAVSGLYNHHDTYINGSGTGLAAWWKLGEGSGDGLTTFMDSSPHGFHSYGSSAGLSFNADDQAPPAD